MYAGIVWNLVVSKLDPSPSTEEDQTLEKRMKIWWKNERVGQFEAFPALFVFTIWETRNRAIFKDTLTSPEITVNILVQKAKEHQKEIKQKPKRELKPPSLDKNTPWDFSMEQVKES